MAESYKSAQIVSTEAGVQYHVGVGPGDVAERVMLVGDPARAGKVEATPVHQHHRARSRRVRDSYRGVPVRPGPLRRPPRAAVRAGFRAHLARLPVVPPAAAVGGGRWGRHRLLLCGDVAPRCEVPCETISECNAEDKICL